jgi:hypothetical protein
MICMKDFNAMTAQDSREGHTLEETGENDGELSKKEGVVQE